MVVFKGKLTNHFTLEEYTVHQTDNCTITREAMKHAELLEEFRRWLKRPMEVNAWYRTAKYNKQVNGNAKSSHLRGVATDISMPGLSEERFVKYAKKWKDICEEHGVVGEAGLYTWGIHLGSHVTYSKTFYNWDSRSGVQKNKAFKI